MAANEGNRQSLPAVSAHPASVARTTVSRQSPDVGPCGSTARRDQCGGQPAMAVPYRDRPERHQRAKMSLSKPHLKGSRPWVNLSEICRLSRKLAWIWRRERFKFTLLTRRERSWWRASLRAASSSRFSPRCRRAWWRWRRAPRRIIGAGADRTRARGSIAAARACEALCPAQQERRGRCGGDLRGSGSSWPAPSCRCVRSTTRPS